MITIGMSESMVQALEVISKDMHISKEKALTKSVALLKIINSCAEKAEDYKLTVETASGKKYTIDLL